MNTPFIPASGMVAEKVVHTPPVVTSAPSVLGVDAAQLIVVAFVVP